MDRVFIVDSTGERLRVTDTAMLLMDLVLHLDELPDKTWRFCYNADLFDLPKVKALRLTGEGDGKRIEVIGVDRVIQVDKMIPSTKPGRRFQLTQGWDKWNLTYSIDLIPDIAAFRELTILPGAS